jgi:HPt (histidine-containing phosphotransfer) domain-containing protein
MNNTKLYLRLLDKFRTGTKTSLDNLSAALGAGDYVKAETEAHTIKGVAANLSLTELYQQAMEADNQLKGGAINEGVFDALSACFAETLAAVDKAIAEHG